MRLHCRDRRRGPSTGSLPLAPPPGCAASNSRCQSRAMQYVRLGLSMQLAWPSGTLVQAYRGAGSSAVRPCARGVCWRCNQTDFGTMNATERRGCAAQTRAAAQLLGRTRRSAGKRPTWQRRWPLLQRQCVGLWQSSNLRLLVGSSALRDTDAPVLALMAQMRSLGGSNSRP